MLNTVRYAMLLSLMVFLSNYAYGSHSAGLDITYECVSQGTPGIPTTTIIGYGNATILIQTGTWANEISWTITNSGGTIVTQGGQGGAYSNNSSYSIIVCLNPGTYTFNWYDSWGDGWNGGSYSVTQGAATLTSASPSWGSAGSSTFYVNGSTPCANIYQTTYTGGTPDIYKITLKFYRECSGIPAPNGDWESYSGDTYLDVFSPSTGLTASLALMETANSGNEITPICPGYNTTCNGGSIPGMQEYIYEGLLSLSNPCTDWTVLAAICCRNPGITNASSAGSIAVTAIINNTTSVGCNNSPTFSQKPVPFLCVNQNYCYNNGAIDIDGDSLVYVLIDPLNNYLPGWTNSPVPLSYISPYSATQPIAPVGSTTFDPQTGNVCMTPNQIQVTVMAIRVDEYRNGVIIGSVIRDIQVTILPCSNSTPTLSGFGGSPIDVSTNPSSAEYTFCSDGVTPINLTINGSDPNSNNTLNMVWNNSIPGASFSITGNNTNSPIGTFSWTPTAANASTIPYYFTVSVTDDACPINASFTWSYSITITTASSAGINNSISVCDTDPPFNLFDQLGGAPTGGGIWYDSNSNIATNNFDPSIQGSNVFTYVVDSVGDCPGDTATIIVTVNNAAPLSHTAAICYGDSIFLQNAWQTQAGIYLDTFLTATCDSIIQTTLSVNILPVVTPNFVVNGNTIIQPGPIYQLTQPSGNQEGSVWNSSLLDLNFPFDFEVELFFGCNNGGADGIAFALQQVSSTIGSSGGGIGYQGISPSFGVEFDTWQNATDPVYDHLAIQRNGDLNHNGINNLFGPIGFPGNINIEDCNWHDVRFIWDPSINLFIVNFDGVQLVNYTVDIINTCFSGNPNVYWGFTAATGGANNLQQFKFKNYNLLDNTICRGDSIQINSLITNSSLSYLWLPNSGINNNISSAPFFSPNTTTTYTLEVINSYSCSFIDTFNIYVDTVDITGITNTSVLCNGGSNGQAMVLVGGNSSFYNYQWNDINNQTTQIAYNLTAGNYNCIVTNDNYCTDTANVTIFEPPPISSVDIQIHCDSYTWVDGITYTVSNNTATYTYINSIGCDSLVTLNLTINSLPNVVANVNPATICVGNQTTLTGSGANTYSWDNGVTDGVPFNPTTTTTYTVTGTDVNGCMNTDMITVNVDQLPTVIANANPATICVGDQTTLTGSGANTYSWDNGVTDGVPFNPTTSTTYTVTGTDINGCIGTNQVSVNVNSIPTASLSGVQDICFGSSTTLNFNLIGAPPFTVNFTDSSSTFNSILDANGDYISGDPILFSPTTNTTFYITDITDVNGCQNIASGSELIIVNPLPTAIILGATTICAGNNTALSFSLNGLPPFTLNYTDGINNFNVVLDSVGNTSTGPVLVSPTANTIYTLLDITDNNSCFNSLSDTTMIAVVQTSSAGNNATATFCADVIAFDMLLELGGNPANGGSWTDAAGNTVSNLFDPATSTPGTYTYTVSAAPCPSTNADLIVNINPLPTVTMSDSTSICIGESTALYFNFTGTGPYNINYDINSTNTSAVLNNNIDSIVVSPSATTTYNLIDVTDTYCSNTANGMADIIVNPLPNIFIGPPLDEICLGDSTDLAFTVLDGTAPFNVTLNDGTVDSYWLMDNNGTINGLPVTISPNNTTTYSLVEATDANGCWNALNGNATIIIYDLPTAIISGGGLICEGEYSLVSFTLQNGLAPYNVGYKINGIQTSTIFNTSGVNTMMLSPSTTTTYSLVDIIDANGCYTTANDSATIDITENIHAIISGGGDICNDGSQATIDILTSDSTSVNVTYTNGFNETILSGIGPFEIMTNQAGVYMITDIAYGTCHGTYSGNATITVNPLPLSEFIFFPQPTDLDNPHINFINHSFGHNSAIWYFGDGSTLNDTISKLIHTYADTGHYKVNLAVSNEFGCTDTIEYTIIIDPVFIIYIPDAFTPNDDGINDAFGPSVYGISKFEMKIYNRWGQVIYHTTEQDKPWDGTINNNETQAGVFTYSIVATDLKEKPHKFVGAFTLFR